MDEIPRVDPKIGIYWNNPSFTTGVYEREKKGLGLEQWRANESRELANIVLTGGEYWIPFALTLLKYADMKGINPEKGDFRRILDERFRAGNELDPQIILHRDCFGREFIPEMPYLNSSDRQRDCILGRLCSDDTPHYLTVVAEDGALTICEEATEVTDIDFFGKFWSPVVYMREKDVGPALDAIVGISISKGGSVRPKVFLQLFREWEKYISGK